MTYTLTIGNTTIHSGDTSVYALETPPLTINDHLTQSGNATFAIYDTNASLFFQPMSKVLLTESVLNICFSGYLVVDQKTNDYPNAAIRHTIKCIDEDGYLAAKRIASGLHDDERMSGQYAGDNVVYLLANYLAQEGVTANYAQQTTSTQSDFATGTLTNVSAMNNTIDGDLELSPAGSTVSKTETTTSDWNSNASLSGLDTTSNELRLASHGALKLTGTCGNNFGNAFVYQEFWNFGYTIQSGDYLTYKVWVNSNSPQIMCGIDFVCSDGTTLRDFSSTSLVDQNGLLAHPKQDLSGFANDQWYYRQISISAMAGKSISFATIAFEGDTQGTYTAYISDIIIYASNLTTHHSDLYYTSGTHTTGIGLAANTQIGNNGYSNVSLSGVVAYEKTGTRISNAVSLTPAGIYQNSLVSWQQTGFPSDPTLATNAIPATTALSINTSLDGAGTFQGATNFAPINNLMPGASLAGRTLQTQQVLSITGKDPIVTPVLKSLTWTLLPSYVATKHDTFKSFSSQSDFNSGTKTNVVANSNGNLTLVGNQRNWIGGSTANQTMFGNGTNSMTIYKGELGITAATGSQAFSRFDFAGAWGSGDFTASIDIQITSASEWSGLSYLTSSFSNLVNSFGYRADVNLTTLTLAKGGNGSTALTSLATAAVSLTAGDVHTLTVAYVQSSHTHKIYIDGTLYITQVDSSYTTAGDIAACFNNSAGSTQTAYFQNFGVVPSTAIIPATPIPSWVSPSISLGSITVENSVVLWNSAQPNGSTIVVNAKVNGGSYVACTNGGVIPGLTAGTVLTGGTVQFQVLIQTPNAYTVPIFNGLTAWILSAYSSSGSRVSPGLNLSQVGRAGSTLINWNASVPSGASLFIDSSLDQKTWTNIGSGAQGSAQIAGITGQADAIDDSFDSNTSSFYTSTSQTNGTEATFVWDTTLSRLEASGGSTGLLLNSSVNNDDVDLTILMDTSDAGGMVWRLLNTSNFYDLVVCDASSASPNQAVLYKITNNSRTTLGTYSSLSWTRNTPHLIRVTMIGAVITVSFDGTSILSYTDNHPLGAGQVGLRNNTFSGQSSANFYFFRIQQLGDSVQNTMVYTRQRLQSTDPTITPQLEDLTVSVRSPNIQTGAFIPSTTYSVLNGSTNKISQDLDDMATQSNYWRKIKVDPLTGAKQLYFQAHNGTLAPFPLTGNDIHEAWGISVTEDYTFFINKAWVLGGVDTVLSSAETFQTNGLMTAFTVAYPIDSIVSIKAGSQSYSFGIQGQDTGKDFYYTPGNKTFSQDASETPLQPGLLLNPVYYGQKNAVANASSASQIQNQAAIDQTSGIIEVASTAPGLNLAGTQQVASSTLQQQGVWPRTLTCTTPRVGLAVGMLVPVFLPSYGLTDWMGLITDLVITWRNDNSRGVMDAVPYFTITAVSGPLLAAWSTTLANRG